MGYKITIQKIVVFSIVFFVNSNVVALAHDKKHEQEKTKTNTSTNITTSDTKEKKLLSAEKLNIIRRERQLDNLHSLFTKVVRTQNPEDQFRLAKMFQSGDGVEKDDVQAYVWTALSLTNGYPGATKTLRDLESSMSTYEVDYAIDLLRKIRELR